LLPLSRDRATRNGLSLSHNGCHLSATSIPGSTFQTCYFAPFQIGFRTRSTFWLHYRVPVCPGHGRFIASGPLHFHLPVRLTAPTVSTPPQDFCIPPDQSVQRRLLPAGPPGEFTRFPFAPRSLFFFKSGLRINVPGSLRTIQLPSGMHGRSCAIRMIGRLASLLPKSGFRPTRINALKRVSRLTPDRNLLLGTAFRSSEKTARFRATFPISMLLAYPFGSPHKSSPSPFDPTTHPRHLVSPRRREFLT